MFLERFLHRTSISQYQFLRREGVRKRTGPESEIVLEDRSGPPAELTGVIGPYAGAPVPEATRLRHQQVV